MVDQKRNAEKRGAEGKKMRKEERGNA